MSEFQKFNEVDEKKQEALVLFAVQEFVNTNKHTPLINRLLIEEVVTAEYLVQYLNYHLLEALKKGTHNTFEEIAYHASLAGFIRFMQKINEDEKSAQILAENFGETISIELQN